MKADDFSNRVLAWFESHGRKDLPWHHNPTPYRVWISEIMLQQTRVVAVIPYYQRFMECFPDVIRLSDGKLDEVLHLWSGLGYYARARNLHAAAQQIAAQHNGKFPGCIEDLIALPGIGRSTAGAILALSMGERHAILDGNVKRVLARYHVVEGWPGRSAVSKELWKLAEHYTPNQQVAEYTQAMMDLGATVCTRSNPQCNRCPLSTNCVAHSRGAEASYPIPKPRRVLPVRSTVMLLACNTESQVLLKRRPSSGIWGGLWSFPELEDSDQIDAWCHRTVGTDVTDRELWPVLRHTFSHFHLDITPVLVQVKNLHKFVAEQDEMIWYTLQQPDARGLAAPVQRLLERLQERLS